jgi:RNA polymerase sigma-70 factor (ECF subfamily)
MGEPPDNQLPGCPTSEDPWHTLLTQVAHGEPAALSALYDATNRIVYTVVLGIVRDPADAEEITIDVYAYVWHSAATYDLNRGKITTWLIMLARSRAIERLRKQAAKCRNGNHNHHPYRLSSEGPVAGAVMAERDRRILIENALQQLPEKDQELIRFAFFSGLSHPELALKLTLPLGTVKTRIRCILSRLRDLIE